MSYLTLHEKERLQREWGNQSDVLGYDNVSMSQLSLAKYSKAIKINRHTYLYFDAYDELWRDDVVALVKKWRCEEQKENEPPTQIQEGLF
jgi:hypothetical protein